MIIQEQMNSSIKVKNTDLGAEFKITLNTNGRLEE